MDITGLGEFGLIRRISKGLRIDRSVKHGIGDDCAVVELDAKNYLLATCDMLVEDVDFTRKDRPALVGRKALAVSLSDIASCAGTPRWALISVGLPKRTPLAVADGIFAGIRSMAARYRVNIVGGDLSRCDKIVIDVCCLGTVRRKDLLLRSTACPGDVIFVTGAFGGSLKGSHLTFTPRLEEARYLVRHHKVHAMIDVSDGLVQDLGHILDASAAGALIFEDLIPVSAQARGIEDALYSGEDFELIFTVAAKDAPALACRGRDFTPIGMIVERRQGFKIFTKAGKTAVLPEKGFRHF